MTRRPLNKSARWLLTRRGHALAVVLLAAGAAVAAAAAASQAAFLTAALGRRAAAVKALLLTPVLTCATGGGSVRADVGDPLPPPLLKDLQRAAPKIQQGADWMFFELKPALDREDLERARECLGSALRGAHVSPLETDMLLPMDQLLSANIDADEDGWTTAVRKIASSIEDIKNEVGSGEWQAARASWEDARANANKVMVDINSRADKEYFVALDKNYEENRYKIYLQKKKDDISERNNKGNLAMR